jgi:long-chain acyl-CoA synthetase
MDDETWFRTGDLGWFDERGYLVYVGRKLDQLFIDGNLVTPSLLDRTLSKHPAIAMAVFFGVPNETGQHLEAAVILNPGQKVTEDDLKVWMKTWIPTQIPLSIHFVSKIPQTSMGKIQRHKLNSMKRQAKL